MQPLSLSVHSFWLLPRPIDATAFLIPAPFIARTYNNLHLKSWRPRVSKDFFSKKEPRYSGLRLQAEPVYWSEQAIVIWAISASSGAASSRRPTDACRFIHGSAMASR